MTRITLDFTPSQAARSREAELSLAPIPRTNAGIVKKNPKTEKPWTEDEWWKHRIIQQLQENEYKYKRRKAVNEAIAAIGETEEIAT